MSSAWRAFVSLCRVGATAGIGLVARLVAAPIAAAARFRRRVPVRLVVLWSLATVAGVTGGLVALAVPGQGSAELAPPPGSLPANCAVAFGTATCTFTYVGAPQYFVVPAGVSSIVVGVDGAQGGAGQRAGGAGGIQAGALAVTGGEQLDVFVGSTHGYNGGGAGGFASGGGGGASDIRTSPFTLGDRVVVAGGGGGGGGAGDVSGPTLTPPGAGGAGGAGGAVAPAVTGGGTPTTLGGGGAGAGATGGAAGAGGVVGGDMGADGTGGGAGSSSQGGSAGTGGESSVAADEFGGDGGGGGGGHVGGGGGGGGAADDTLSTAGGGGGGGGGSSYIVPSAVAPSSTTGVRTGNGAVQISFAVTPANVTSAPGASFPTEIAHSFKVTASGVPTPALSETGALPAGVRFTDNGDGTATITGTAALASVGNYQLTITATNRVSTTGTQSFDLVVPGPPSATINAPGTGGTYVRGKSVRTAFGCADSGEAPGISSCTDSNGRLGSMDTGSGSTGSGTLNTSALGFHTYAVTARSHDGQSAQASISYAVIAASVTVGTVKIERAKIDSKHDRATFSFKAIGTATGFRCALIKQKKHHKYPKPSFASCHSPKAYEHLKPRSYRFEVEAVSATSHSTPASKSFTIT